MSASHTVLVQNATVGQFPVQIILAHWLVGAEWNVLLIPLMHLVLEHTGFFLLFSLAGNAMLFHEDGLR